MVLPWDVQLVKRYTRLDTVTQDVTKMYKTILPESCQELFFRTVFWGRIEWRKGVQTTVFIQGIIRIMILFDTKVMLTSIFLIPIHPMIWPCFCQSERHERTTSLVVTGTTLTFILLAATMVTITFLMSPVIEEMFGELLEPGVCIILHIFSRQ